MAIGFIKFLRIGTNNLASALSFSIPSLFTEAELKVNYQLGAYATRFLIVNLKKSRDCTDVLLEIPEFNATELITTQLCFLT